MYNEVLDFFDKDIKFIKGVGPVLSDKLSGLLGGCKVWNFLCHIPVSIKKRKFISKVKDGIIGEDVVIKLKIGAIKKGGYFKGRQMPTKVMCYDEEKYPILIQFFSSKFVDYWLKQMPKGSYRYIVGRLDRSGELFAINHPDYILTDYTKIQLNQAVYPLTEGITQKIMLNLRDEILPLIPNIDEWQTGKYIKSVPSFKESLTVLHNPKTDEEILPENIYRIRLAYDELLASQVSIAMKRRDRVQKKGLIINSEHLLIKKALSNLPFELTDAQKKVLKEILTDMKKDVQMARLLMGDVGSGKTIVALLSMLNAVEAGYQTVLMAPTDVLAVQHFTKIKSVCDVLGICCEILSGRDSGKIRHEKLVSLASGKAKIIVGTHAVFQDDVIFKNLGFAVIDEQHRFGVEQRFKLIEKGVDKQPIDILSMSATPIPRTLSMTMYGDMDISVIDHKPANRKRIITTKLSLDRLGDLMHRLQNEIVSGSKVFWVCPLVSESETSDLMAVEERFEVLRQFFGDKVAMIHGKMDKASKDKIMNDFANCDSKIRILVSTTVIEVGVDVPEASIMIIENANRFGLAALHQLRGRVGRGSKQSYCILLFNNGISQEAFKRINILCETDDGFEIAEADLMMRGNGELLGIKQSGYVNYKFVDYAVHRKLFQFAQKEAVELIQQDPELRSEIGYKIRVLLNLFGKYSKSNYIQA